MTTIPISQVVSIQPGVVGAGGAASRLGGVVLTQDASIPPGQPKTFFTATDTDNWFGVGTPEDIASVVRFLCGPGASFITGQNIQVNGGSFLG